MKLLLYGLGVFGVGLGAVIAASSNASLGVGLFAAGLVGIGTGSIVSAIENSTERIIDVLAAKTSAKPVVEREAPAVAEAPDDAAAKVLVKQAEDLHFAKKFAEARAIYERVVVEYPDSKQADAAKRQLDNLRNL
jgi:hypothetical protein